MSKIRIRTLPCYLKALGEAIDVFSGGEEGKQRQVEIMVDLLLIDKEKEIYTLLVPMNKIIKEVGTNNTSLPKPNHWILSSIKLNEGEKDEKC